MGNTHSRRQEIVKEMESHPDEDKHRKLNSLHRKLFGDSTDLANPEASKKASEKLNKMRRRYNYLSTASEVLPISEPYDIPGPLDIISKAHDKLAEDNSDHSESLNRLQDRHSNSYNRWADNVIPGTFERLARHAWGRNETPIRLRIGRVTENIVGYGTSLFKWLESGDLRIKSEDPGRIGQLVTRANELHVSVSGKGNKEKILRELTNINRALQAWNNYQLKRGGLPPLLAQEISQEVSERDLSEQAESELAPDSERRKRIEQRLGQLPEKPPTLSDLPKELWWKLYIDKAHHEAAKLQPNPAMYYDQDKSPGYSRSMEELFETYLVTRQTSKQKKWDYKGYTNLHESSIKYVPLDQQKKMRQWNGMVRNELNTMGIVDERLDLEGSPKRQEQIAALDELRNEQINGVPLLQDWPIGVQDIDPSVSNLLPSERQKLPEGIMIVKFVTDASDRDISFFIIPLYSPKEGPKYVNAILNSYEKGRKAPNQSKYQRLREIVRHTRNLAVLHQKSDGAGRSTVYGFFYACLKQEGFPLAILPLSQNIFGGRRTLDGLMEDALTGMESFIDECKQHGWSPSQELD